MQRMLGSSDDARYVCIYRSRAMRDFKTVEDI